MLVEYLGLVAMLALAIAMALGLYALADRLRAGFGTPSAAAEAPARPAQRADARRNGPPSSRYFFVAIVGATLHAGSFYFYLWGATVREVGLTGLVAMLGFGMCLVVGVFYSWARGAVSYATRATRPETEARPG